MAADRPWDVASCNLCGTMAPSCEQKYLTVAMYGLRGGVHIVFGPSPIHTPGLGRGGGAPKSALRVVRKQPAMLLHGYYLSTMP